MLNIGMLIIRLNYPIVTITITLSLTDVLHAIKNANIVIFAVKVNIFKSVL